MIKPFIPKNFVVPKVLETDELKLRILTVNDVVKDYDAVMTSIDHLQGVFGKLFDWPSPDLTFEQDLIDLGWHQKESQLRSSFAYTVMNPDESQCLGCVYIFPSIKSDFYAEVYMWVRKSEFDKGLDPILYETVRDWIKKQWPFEKVAYPGREIKWEDWEALEQGKNCKKMGMFLTF